MAWTPKVKARLSPDGGSSGVGVRDAEVTHA
jgi:hypothetical protein